jgi:hypothetical protein
MTNLGIKQVTVIDTILENKTRIIHLTPNIEGDETKSPFYSRMPI